MARATLSSKGPEIFDRAAAPADNHSVKIGQQLGPLQGLDYAGGGSAALHGGVHYGDAQAGIASPEYGEHVVDSRTLLRGDKRNVARPVGQGPLALLTEQSFFGQLALELFHGQLKGAGTKGCHAGDGQLPVAAGFVESGAGLDQHLLAFFGDKAEFFAGGTKQGAAHLGPAVLEREIPVPGRRASQVGEFTGDLNAGEGRFQQIAGLTVEFADRENGIPAGAGRVVLWSVVGVGHGQAWPVV